VDQVAPRRRFLQASLAAGSVFAPAPFAWVRAQPDGAARLLRAPKAALVLGNAAYRNAPALRNPANDAQAIAGALRSCGFDVVLRLDLTRTAVEEAVRDYVKRLAASKGVGLFYYAGHGVQLAWRNYLIPVDAAIARLDDVAAQGVDVARLIEGLTQAANPMNVVVLDACRENPFGRDFREAQKGLSQMDAPPATLIAYATAPGHLAADGEGANGLYTENLLREMRVPEAKIEDVFKRVRLSVRRRTKGEQIPWESTSLEEDFWFLPPKEVRELSDEQRDREFQAQLAAWESVKGTGDPDRLAEFLVRYPSGDYAELAQLRLDQLLARRGEGRIQAVSGEGNPFSKGTVRFDTAYRVGDSYTYRRLDLETRAEKGHFTTTITEIDGARVVYDNGFITDLLGNTLRMPDGRVFTDNQNVPVEFEVGKHWTTRFRIDSPKGFTAHGDLAYQIVTREKVTVPAGTFNAFVVEGVGVSTLPKATQEIHIKFWWDPQHVRRQVAREETRTATGARRRASRLGEWRRAPPEMAARTRVLVSERQELVSYKQS
jgi:hypothetical protein